MSDRVVIMNEGRIEQLDSPRGIYRSPATRFVAEFVGSNNILPGTVTTVGETVELETDTGRFQSIPGEGQHCTVGSPASLVVSADLIRLPTAPSGHPNEIECRFISEEFVGSVVTLLTETAAGDDFKIQISQLAKFNVNSCTVGHVGANLYNSSSLECMQTHIHITAPTSSRGK